MSRKIYGGTLSSVLPLLLLGLGLSGCQNWGQEVLDFVRAEGRSLSDEYAQATLESQWSQFQLHTPFEILNRIEIFQEEAARRTIDLSHIQQELSKRHTQGAWADHLMDLSRIQRAQGRAQQELASLEQALVFWEGSCANREVFERSGLRAAGTLGVPEFTQPGRQFYLQADLATASVCVSTLNPIACVGMGISLLFTGWGEKERREQARIFEEAMELFKNEKLVKGKELFEKSRRICEEKAALTQSLRREISTAVVDLKQNHSAQIQLIQIIRPKLNQAFYAQRVEEGYARSPLGREVKSELAQAKLNRARARDRQLRIELMQTLADAADAHYSGQCFRASVLIETIEDQLERVSEKTRTDLERRIRELRLVTPSNGGCSV